MLDFEIKQDVSFKEEPFDELEVDYDNILDHSESNLLNIIEKQKQQIEELRKENSKLKSSQEVLTRFYSDHIRKMKMGYEQKLKNMKDREWW